MEIEPLPLIIPSRTIILFRFLSLSPLCFSVFTLSLSLLSRSHPELSFCSSLTLSFYLAEAKDIVKYFDLVQQAMAWIKEKEILISSQVRMI